MRLLQFGGKYGSGCSEAHVRNSIGSSMTTNIYNFGSTLAPGFIPLKAVTFSSVQTRHREICYRLDLNLRALVESRLDDLFLAESAAG